MTIVEGQQLLVDRWCFQSRPFNTVAEARLCVCCSPKIIAALPDVGEALTLTAVSRNQAGEYSCQADNGVPPAAKKSVKVDVLCMYCTMSRFGESAGARSAEESFSRSRASREICFSSLIQMKLSALNNATKLHIHRSTCLYPYRFRETNLLCIFNTRMPYR